MTAYADTDYGIALYGPDYITVSFDRDQDGILGAGDLAAAALMFDVVTARFNGILLGRVPLPFAEVPLDIKKYCVDVVVYEMCPTQSTRTEEKIKRKDDAESWLRAVRDNKVKFAVGGADEPASANAPHLTQGPATVTAEQSTFEMDPGAREYTREKLKGTLI